jgi:hypothetical protein
MNLEEVNMVELGKPVVDFKRFSSWNLLVRTIARVKMFIRLIRKTNGCRTLTPEIMEEAESIIICWSQREGFSNDWNKLSKDGRVHYRSALAKWNPCFDEKGLIRTCGRQGHLNVVDRFSKMPIMPPKHHVTDGINFSHRTKKSLCGHFNTKNQMPNARKTN